jgi:hypothetical protein
MFRRGLVTLVLGCFLTGTGFSAEIIVRTRPPRPLHERRLHSPGPGYVWAPGYHRWDGRAYAWSPGQWMNPPHRRAHWVPSHWQHRRDGWVFVEGHWR